MSRLLQRCADAELLARTAKEPEVFATFYRRHEVLVVRFLLSRCRDPELAADLTAEVFATVLEVADDFDPEQSGPTAVPWLLTIALNTLRKSFRRGAVAEDARQRLGCEPVSFEDAEIAWVEELASRESTLEELLGGLPEDVREAVIARVVEEREYEEIAGELGSSQMVIRKRVSRGLARLRTGLPHTRKGERP
jgi:RNA polymerase sigma factor (sigma-70 family)